MKMKGVLLFAAVCVAAAASEAPGGPYPPSGWRPDGLTLQLPQRQIQTSSQRERYLPPAQAARPAYGAPSPATPSAAATDLSVQGLPATEQTPLFKETPLSGRQYVGRQFNEDLRQLLEEQRRLQAEKQRFANRGSQPNSFGSGQRGCEGDHNTFSSPTPSPNINTELGSSQDAPFQSNTYYRTATPSNPQGNINSGFGSQTPSTVRFGNPNQFQPSNPTQSTTPRENEVPKTGTNFRTNTSPQNPQEEEDTTTENEDTNDSLQTLPKASVEISQQMLRELPENYPNQLVQLALQQQYPSVPFTQQIGQLQAPVFYQPAQGYSPNLISQPQTVGIQTFDPRNPSDFAAYDGLNAQRQVALPQSFSQQGFYPTGQLSGQQFAQAQPAEIQPQYQQAFQIPGQQASLNPYNVATTLDFQRLVQVQRQGPIPANQIFKQNGLTQAPISQNTPVVNPSDAAQSQDRENQEDVYQSQNQPGLPSQVQGRNNVPAFSQQPQFPQQPGLFQNGFDVNQRGNGLDSSKPDDEDQEGENDQEVADVPAAGFPRFGERLPPGEKVAVPQRPYGPPQSSGVDAKPPATTDAPRENDQDYSGGEGGDGGTVVVATAVADGRKRKSRLRNIRPLYTVNMNGELVQLQ